MANPRQSVEEYGKQFRERAPTAPVREAADEQETSQSLASPVRQQLQTQFGRTEVDMAISGEDQSPFGTFILAEWAMGTAGLGSLTESSPEAGAQVHGLLQSEEWGQASAGIISRYAASNEPAHAHLAVELIRRSRGQRLPTDVAARLSAALGVDISDAVIHTDAAAAQAAKAVNAHAFATGKDVFFAAGAYKPGTREGDELLAHELTHVVQDAEGRIPMASGEGLTVSTPNQSHEREAERAGREAADALHDGSGIDAALDAGVVAADAGELSAVADLQGDAMLHRSADASGTGGPDGGDTDEYFRELAEKIHAAVTGLGTDEEAIYEALEQLEGNATMIMQLKAVYQETYGVSLDEDLEGDMSGGELDRAKNAIGVDDEKARFLSSEPFGPLDIAHSFDDGHGFGGFEATYIPLEQSLVIRVTGKIRLLDAVTGAHGSFTTPTTDLNDLVEALNGLPEEQAAEVLPYFQWSTEDTEIALGKYRARLAESVDIWENTDLKLGLDDPTWSDVEAKVKIDLAVETVGEVSESEHLQITVYKEPSASEQSTVYGYFSDSGQDPSVSQGIRANAGTNLHYWSDPEGSKRNWADTNPLQNEMSLSSSDLDAGAGNEAVGDYNHLKRPVWFRGDGHELHAGQIQFIQEYAAGFTEGDSDASNNAITLRGYAPGTESHALTAQRLAAVRAALTTGGVAGSRITTENRSDDSSSVSRGLVEIRIGNGERQNTLAHEFGHIFGLSDEYPEGSRATGGEARHHHRAEEVGIEGGARVEQNDNIISVGNVVRPQHYATFAWALNQLTSSAIGDRMWHVKE